MEKSGWQRSCHSPDLRTTRVQARMSNSVQAPFLSLITSIFSPNATYLKIHFIVASLCQLSKISMPELRGGGKRNRRGWFTTERPFWLLSENIRHMIRDVNPIL